ncbi:MAG: DNA phosphorothioation-dependent restriction protein DptG [bacterium]
MPHWNQYINDFYYPKNTSDDAPEKILYFFIREGLCKNPDINEDISRTEDTNWEELFKKVKFNEGSRITKYFKEHYLIQLRGGTGGVFPVPFHSSIPNTFMPMSKNSDRKLDNKGFNKKFLFLFLNDGKNINYKLIQKLWKTLSTDEGLNYYERFLLEQIRIKNGISYELKSFEDIQSDIKGLSLDIKKFKCKYQPKQFQQDLSFILKLKLSRVDKINWIQDLIYFHFSTYMYRIYWIIKKEEENFLNDESDYCSRCTGLTDCPAKGRIITKSSLSGNTNRETKQIKQCYRKIKNDILIKGYYRFIALNQLIRTYNYIKDEKPKGIRDIASLYKNKTQEFIKVTKDRLKTYTKLTEQINIDNYINEDMILNLFTVIYEIYKEYYELINSRSADTATVQVYNKLAGDKMGCKYLRFRTRGENFYFLNNDFLSFITNIILNNNKQILIHDFWRECNLRGFTYASNREKLNIERQLSNLGHLEKKSDAGESLYVTKTVEEVE